MEGRLLAEVDEVTFARTWASRKLGRAIAIRIRMMAITIRSSISVKPWVFVLQ